MKKFLVPLCLVAGFSLILIVTSMGIGEDLPGIIVASNDIEFVLASVKGPCTDTEHVCEGVGVSSCNASTAGNYCAGCKGSKHKTCKGIDEKDCNESYNQYCCGTTQTCFEYLKVTYDQFSGLPIWSETAYACDFGNSNIPEKKYNTRILCN